MRLLLDTHMLVWFTLADAQHSSVTTSLIMDRDYENGTEPQSFY